MDDSSRRLPVVDMSKHRTRVPTVEYPHGLPGTDLVGWWRSVDEDVPSKAALLAGGLTRDEEAWRDMLADRCGDAAGCTARLIYSALTAESESEAVRARILAHQAYDMYRQDVAAWVSPRVRVPRSTA